MFTGIVQGLGEVLAVDQRALDFRSHTVRLPEGADADLRVGASVAHNGCCLTITRIHENGAADFDLMGETLAKTNLGALQPGDKVNIERAARFGDEIGGHSMSGHITATAEISRIEANGLNRTVWFRLPENLKGYVFPKGFIGLDGCSLTIGKVSDSEFNVYLIPETLNRTLFGSRRVGERVNVEIDPQTQVIVDTVARILAEKDNA